MGLVGVGCQVQIGEQQLAFAQHLAFASLGFFHLHDHVGGGKDLFRGVDDRGAGGDIVLVGEARAHPGTSLDNDFVTVGHGLLCGVRGHPDAEFLGFDFSGASDLHRASSRKRLIGITLGEVRRNVLHF